MISALGSTLSLQKVFGAAAPPRRRAAAPPRRYAATPLRRYAATPLRLFSLDSCAYPRFNSHLLCHDGQTGCAFHA